MRKLFQKLLGRVLPASTASIAELLQQYAEEGCDFTDIEWVKKTALRLVSTMPDSQARCLLYVLAVGSNQDLAEGFKLDQANMQQAPAAAEAFSVIPPLPPSVLAALEFYAEGTQCCITFQKGVREKQLSECRNSPDWEEIGEDSRGHERFIVTTHQADAALQDLRVWLDDIAETNRGVRDTPSTLQPIQTIKHWANAYADSASGSHFQGHGMVVKLLREYELLRTFLAAEPNTASNNPLQQEDMEALAMLDFVCKNGLPMCRDGLYRYHGVLVPVWHETQKDAIRAAMQDFRGIGEER